jgi:putative ATP-dependent endonuclease of OLD family
VHISKIQVRNYRCFDDATFLFRPGLNVIIGENNAGKSALFSAMRLALDSSIGGLSVHDFHYAALQSEEPPRIVVIATVQVEADDSPEDKAAVASWLTRLEFPWEAELSLVYELPTKHHEPYKKLREAFGEGDESEMSAYAIEVMQDRGWFVAKHYGGKLENRFSAEPELRSHFRCRFLDALRDAETHLKSGSARLLQSMLRQVLDFGSEEDSRAEKQRDFRGEGEKLVNALKSRLSTKPLFDMASEIWGAGQQAKPDLFGRLTELEVLRSIWLFLDHMSYRHPVSHNGLGYNNLLYVGLVLAGMEAGSAPDEPRGFPLLLMEEPEAHLHPALQYRFLVFLREQLRSDGEGEVPRSRQVFLTTHSTQVTSAAGLDPLVCLYLGDDGAPKVSYPGRAFSKGKEGVVSKAYVERFLDATKSSMLFAKAVLLVEGIAEQVLIPGLVDLAWGGRTAWLERNFVSLVRVDGVTFKHFLPLFGMVDEPGLAAMGLQGRRVALLTDGDPMRSCRDGDKTKTVACWPYESGAQPSATAKCLLELRQNHAPQLYVGVADKTFEYDLVYANPTATLLLSEATTFAAEKREQLEKLMAGAEPLETHWKVWWKDALDPLESFAGGCQDKDLLRRTALATYYLLAYKDSKGEHASTVVAALDWEIKKKAEERTRILLPNYLDGALRHVCVLEPPEALKETE